VADHLDPVTHEAALSTRLGAIHAAELGLGLAGVSRVGREMNAHPSECRVTGPAATADVPRNPDVEERR